MSFDSLLIAATEEASAVRVSPERLFDPGDRFKPCTQEVGDLSFKCVALVF